MQFQVPQFIEVEDKIFGPLTLKQFIYLAGGVGIAVVLYFLIPIKFIAILLAVPFLAFSATLAFYKLNSKPFVEVLEAAIYYSLRNKLYIWKKQNKVKPVDTRGALKDAKTYASVMVPKISDSKLKDMTWSLDIKESLYSDRNQK